MQATPPCSRRCFCYLSVADGFGRLAWVYEGLERTVYAGLLQQARLALLDELTEANASSSWVRATGVFCWTSCGATKRAGSRCSKTVQAW